MRLKTTENRKTRASVTGAVRSTLTPGAQRFLALLFIAVLLALPWLGLPRYWITAVLLTIIYVPAAIGQNIIAGNAGQLAMGQAAFVAVGAYAAGYLSTQHSLDGTIILIIGAVLAGVGGLLVGIPGLRVSGDYLFVVTLGINLIAIDVALNWKSVTGGAGGIFGLPALSLFGNDVGFGNGFYFACVGIVLVATAIARLVMSSRYGLTVEAVRDDKVAAHSVGIRSTGPMLSAFAFGSMLAGISGVLLAYNLSYVGYGSFSVDWSILIFEMAVIGGLGRIPGAVLGAFIIILIPEALRPLQPYRELLGGIVMIAMMIYRPQGILGGKSISNLIKKSS